MDSSPWLRLEALLTLSEVSARQIDRLADRTEGQLALAIARRQGALRFDVAASYARVFGCTVGYILAGEGTAPTASAVQAAVAAARARAAAPAASDFVEPATGTHG